MNNPLIDITLIPNISDIFQIKVEFKETNQYKNLIQKAYKFYLPNNSLKLQEELNTFDKYINGVQNQYKIDLISFKYLFEQKFTLLASKNQCFIAFYKDMVDTLNQYISNLRILDDALINKQYIDISKDQRNQLIIDFYNLNPQFKIVGAYTKQFFAHDINKVKEILLSNSNIAQLIQKHLVDTPLIVELSFQTIIKYKLKYLRR